MTTIIHASRQHQSCQSIAHIVLDIAFLAVIRSSGRYTGIGNRQVALKLPKHILTRRSDFTLLFSPFLQHTNRFLLHESHSCPKTLLALLPDTALSANLWVRYVLPQYSYTGALKSTLM